MDEIEELLVLDAAAWRAWLAVNTPRPRPSGSCSPRRAYPPPTSISYDQALEEALCQGWIDGQVRRRDDATYRQRFTRRRARSAWSKRNVGSRND